MPEIEVLHLERSYGFFNTLTEKEKEEVRQMYGELWDRIKERIAGGEFRVLVIDEFMAAYRYGLIGREDALGFLEGKPEALEVVLTGSGPDRKRSGTGADSSG